MLVNVLAELEARGVEPPGGLSCVDWLRAHDPGLTAAAARAFVAVARAVNEPRWALLRRRVSMQHISVAKGAQIVGFHERTHLVADPVELDQAIGDLTAQAPNLRAEELARLVRHHTEQITPPPDHDRIDEGRRQSRGAVLRAAQRDGHGPDARGARPRGRRGHQVRRRPALAALPQH